MSVKNVLVVTDGVVIWKVFGGFTEHRKDLGEKELSTDQQGDIELR